LKILIDNSIFIVSTYAKTMFFERFSTQRDQQKNIEININPGPSYSGYEQ